MAYRTALALLVLSSLGIAAHSRQVVSVAAVSDAGHKRKLNTAYCSPANNCNPADLNCAYWENPCPDTNTIVPASLTTGVCVDDYATGALFDHGPAPTVACASSWAVAVTNMGGCAKVTTAGFSAAAAANVWEQATTLTTMYIEQWLSGSMTVSAAAYSIATAQAEAAAFVMTKYFQQACYCCNKPEYLFGGAKADATAVATAVTQSFVTALSVVKAQYPTFVGVATQYIGASATGGAIAADLQAITTSVYAQFVGLSVTETLPGQTAPPMVFTKVFPLFNSADRGTAKCFSLTYSQCKEALAEAFVCTVVSTLSKIQYDSNYMTTTTALAGGGTTTELDTARATTWATACSQSVAIAGNGFAKTCDVDCPCGSPTDPKKPLVGICVEGAQCTAVTETSFGCTCKSSTATLCEGKGCFELASDNENCGACGNICGVGKYCYQGACKCKFGVDCNGDCKDTQTDPTCCGSCNNACSAGLSCQLGLCKCPTGTLQAGKLPVCGSCGISLSTSSTNCGSCGTVCPTGSSCSGGACKCNMGTPLGGKAPVCNSCSNTPMTTTTNCGSCGNSCPPSSAPTKKYCKISSAGYTCQA